ncbi:MAG: hypothetical protein GX803_00145 [Lentisphaerae bacterium]|jgi:transcription elongation GreA/GreB family factor|nr:hypothetical protein [Lentisphaerota bacterium]
MSSAVIQQELENRVLALLEPGGGGAQAWLEVLDQAREAGLPEAFKDWLDMAHEALGQAEDVDGAIHLLAWRAVHMPPEMMTGKEWLRLAESVAGADATLRTLVQEAGFGQPLAARECVRRLRLLRSLKPGTICLTRAWGLGVVRDMDILYKKVIIDFRGRPGHGLAMKVAAETLELLKDDHLLARWYREREVIRQMVQDAPTDVARLALASLGPMSPAILQERLIHYGLVDAADWKRFWEAARKGLKADPTVAFPAKRTEPIHLLDRPMGYDDAWFDRLGAERDVATILGLVREWIENPAKPDPVAPAWRAVLANRLAFVIQASGQQQPGQRLLAALLAHRLGLTADECNWPAAADDFLDSAALLPLLNDLKAQERRAALEFLWSRNGEAVKAGLLEHLTAFTFPVLQDALAWLLQQDAGRACGEIFAEACRMLTIRQDMLLWVMRNPETAAAWGLPPLTVLAPRIVDELEQDYTHEDLKTQKLLRKQFLEPDMLQTILGGMSPGQQSDYFRRLGQSAAWSGLDRRAMQARVLKLFPHLQSVIGDEDVTQARVVQGGLTSQRSYRELQEKLHKLVHEEIPANSKEIAVARSYGDLSENFEYKAAKDMQRVLMARQAELEELAARVRPTDFADTPVDVAGIGTTVELAYLDGRTEQYHILGELDQFPERRIMSSSARLAKALLGKGPGDTAMVPGDEGGEAECRIVNVMPLPADIVEWAR